MRQGVPVAVEGVSKSFLQGKRQTHRALNNVDLAIKAGSTVALTGPSGSGKSTLLHLIGGMERPSEGHITVGETRVDQLSVRDLTRYRRNVGFVFQKFHLLPGLTVIDNVIAPVLPRRVSFKKSARAQELLESVGLGDRALSMPHELSGGQQQRVAIARAVIGFPDLLIADEPTGSLDGATGEEIMQLLLTTSDTWGTTLVVATHNLKVAELCQQHVQLVDGAIHRTVGV
ncbi:ABC transporter ATP-binding protein [Agromyces sp. ISL-38]|uniref:ABC transporter ATP-binding protein n=1 Tax=Agromyces sp. ISL-38 TaxID=2819107 RepID=UPI001BE66A96|nr:ABC transporter ATP-binding protein [Agromyces sp. ISL-38]MBT2500071.1 ABC transporter ATP-binding protein [Agromyces sp. ISL-38]